LTAAFWTYANVAHALEARLTASAPHGSRALGNVSTDTRTIRAGDIFVAIVGERFDAHDFVRDALEAGARAIVASRPVDVGGADAAVFAVDDTLLALGDLARFRRMVWGGTVVAVAGSNGKTSTKELLRAALGSRMRVHATTGNLNNRVGVPLTLLALPFDSDIAVVEVGTSIPGELGMLRDITRPDVAIVTSIAEEHLEGFGDIAGVLREETSIFRGVAVGIIPSDDDVLAAASRSSARLVRAGLDAGDIFPSAWRLEPDGSGVVILDDILVRSPLRGVHNLRNLMLALAAARELGVDTRDAARGISALVPPPMRANWQRVGSALVINDAYNSNPGSAIAAIEMLAAAPGEQKVAILGSMLELGANSDRCHDDVTRAALASPAALVAGVGEFAASLRRVGGGDRRVVTAADVDQLWAELEPRLAHDATILLKGSRGARLERMLPHITGWANRDC
jgi:UDP-N-acetylmuramoyl-tripeptide--D-alanyl-D-alanine ligase